MSRRSRRPTTVAAVLAWSVLAGIVAVGELLEPAQDAVDSAAPGALVFGDRGSAPSPSAPIGAPFTRYSAAELLHGSFGAGAVRSAGAAHATGDATRAVDSARPPASATKARHRELPRPFAAMRTFASPLITPRLSLPRVLAPRLSAIEGLAARARPGQPVAVRISAYCLRGITRRGREVRPGIIAADPSVFPLARHVELIVGGRYLGKFLVDDTGHRIRGTRIDVWTPDCDDARRFGMRDGVATLVTATP